MRVHEYRLKAADLLFRAEQAVDPEQADTFRRLALSYEALAAWLEKGRSGSRPNLPKAHDDTD